MKQNITETCKYFVAISTSVTNGNCETIQSLFRIQRLNIQTYLYSDNDNRWYIYYDLMYLMFQ